MVPAQRYGTIASLKQIAHCALNFCKIFVNRVERIRQAQIARVGERARRAQIHSQFRPLVRSIIPQSCTDLRRRTRRSTEIRRIHIERNSDESRHVLCAFNPGDSSSVYGLSLSQTPTETTVDSLASCENFLTRALHSYRDCEISSLNQ